MWKLNNKLVNRQIDKSIIMKLYYVLLLLAFPLSAQINVVPQPNDVHYYKGSCKVDTPITYVKDSTIANPEGYQLVIQPRKITVKYSAEAGKVLCYTNT